MAKDGTTRGGRRVRAGDKPLPAAERIQSGLPTRIMNNDIPTLAPAELESVALPEGAVLAVLLRCRALPRAAAGSGSQNVSAQLRRVL